MKPGDHPDFFRVAPPPGTSRESTIVLDRDGRFFHDGGLVEDGPLARALHRWIARHPEDGRLILTNGYDWTYFRAEGAPYAVAALRVDETRAAPTATCVLDDETEEPLDPRTLSLAPDGVVYARVKGGDFDARFTRHAQTQLAPLLVADDPPTVAAGDARHVLGAWVRDPRDDAPIVPGHRGGA